VSYTYIYNLLCFARIQLHSILILPKRLASLTHLLSLCTNTVENSPAADASPWSVLHSLWQKSIPTEDSERSTVASPTGSRNMKERDTR
jgi:hypothetical protein